MRSANISASRSLPARPTSLPAIACCPACSPTRRATAATSSAHWAGQLGDGRAITLGEIIATDGTRQELQLKGAGRTPYSRTADGRAVLRSSLREFVCSEAMHFLGVPTTRALSLVGTGEQVIRDMFYDGHPEPEPGAVVCRVAPSFVRFGNFQIHAANDEHGRASAPGRLRHPEVFPGTVERLLVFRKSAAAPALLIADWMRLGFVHGVMNTDNMSILGLTIDYGPYGWLEGYDPQWTPNTTDAQTRRYCYGNQPQIAQWNLARLGRGAAAADPGQGTAGRRPDDLRRDLQHGVAARARAQARLRGARPARRRRAGLRPLRPALRGRDRLHDLLPQSRARWKWRRCFPPFTRRLRKAWPAGCNATRQGRKHEPGASSA